MAQPLGCDGQNRAGDGPCDIKVVFPGNLIEHDDSGPTGARLDDYLYGRLHGMITDPQNRYMNVNLFGPGNGFVGIIDGATKEAVALFRVTATTSGQRVHMSDWSKDGNSLLIANLNGKILERIDLTRDEHGTIVAAEFKPIGWAWSGQVPRGDRLGQGLPRRQCSRQPNGGIGHRQLRGRRPR